MTRRSRRLTRLATTVLLAVIAFIFAFPLFYLIATSLKTKADLFAPIPSLFPPAPTIDPYVSVLFTRGFAGLLVNSIIVGLSATILAICVAFAICYPITRLPAPPRLRAFVLNWALSLRFLPPVTRSRSRSRKPPWSTGRAAGARSGRSCCRCPARESWRS